ncbi:unnamed protein product [Timema podura]|uniref:Uncharacterized protein n=1 Tax=Timema podura TaxID=61482 RepID=A0ABN7NEV5_TIMPD|nr:unnamed protein product [Timema podura]
MFNPEEERNESETKKPEETAEEEERGGGRIKEDETRKRTGCGQIDYRNDKTYTYSSFGTETLELSNVIHTCTPISTWVGGALVNVDPTVWASKSRSTFTEEPVDSIYTLATIETWQRVAVIDVMLAMLPFKPFLANAGVKISCVHTRCSVLTWFDEDSTEYDEVTNYYDEHCSLPVNIVSTGNQQISFGLKILTDMTCGPFPIGETKADIGVPQILTSAAIAAGAPVLPFQPSRHEHTKSAIPSKQLPLLRQGFGMHSSLSVDDTQELAILDQLALCVSFVNHVKWGFSLLRAIDRTGRVGVNLVFNLGFGLIPHALARVHEWN